MLPGLIISFVSGSIPNGAGTVGVASVVLLSELCAGDSL